MIEALIGETLFPGYRKANADYSQVTDQINSGQTISGEQLRGFWYDHESLSLWNGTIGSAEILVGLASLRASKFVRGSLLGKMLIVGGVFLLGDGAWNFTGALVDHKFRHVFRDEPYLNSDVIALGSHQI